MTPHSRQCGKQVNCPTNELIALQLGIALAERTPQLLDCNGDTVASSKEHREPVGQALPARTLLHQLTMIWLGEDRACKLYSSVASAWQQASAAQVELIAQEMVRLAAASRCLARQQNKGKQKESLCCWVS